MAMQREMSLMEFQKKFNTEDACANHLFEMRYAEGFICPKCGGRHYYTIKTRRLFQCKNCGHQTSLTVGTVLEKTHLSLQIWFWAIFLVSTDKRGCSASMLSRQLELPYNTAWFLLHRIRKAMTDREKEYILCGIVELDDSYFGRSGQGEKSYGRGTNRANVLIALSKNDKGKPCYLKMQLVDQVGGDSVKDFAKKLIEKGTIIQTDGLNWYKKPLSYGYIHDARNMKANTYPDWLISIHIIIGNVKNFINGTYHGLGTKHLQAYLDEFSYRFNRRSFHSQLFNRLLFATLSAKPISFSELT